MQPIDPQKPIQVAKTKFNFPYIRNRVVEVADENIIMYIPVAELTFGETPILIRIGLKIDPPPYPRAPDTNPPTNPKRISLTKLILL